MWTRRLTMMISLLMLIGNCGRKPSSNILVVTTIPVTADWVKQVGNGRVTVFSLLKGQEEPHSYEPSPAAMEVISRAKLVVRIGLGLDDWLDGLLKSSPNRNLKVLTLAEGVKTVKDYDEEEEETEAHKGHGVHKEGNPHIWLDPEVAKLSVRRIADQLKEIDPEGSAIFQKRMEGYIQQIDSLVAVLKSLADGLKNRKFVAMHNSWPYFCRAFGMEMVDAVEPLPGQEPSVNSLSKLIKRMVKDSVRVIVIEPQHNPDFANVLSRETGARVITLSQFNGVLPGVDSYLELLDYDVRTLVAALKAPKLGEGQVAE